ncbi:hypothetical protein [Alicyclobacillus cycloheptanicus]|uniref:Uncharacterized protein YpuA (DUF1002 family) n=1 Tax=Alicyclobacillus cycloheptanicus TaxID=1457 RepID=A0ABT9XMY4_9BACL|nr:hypothetical protein [Alicyclobacillus cycloheptanicus]MDQ0191389.1 uncharacterized protein YpuA (DUF1002 family) [Alicyclobacillus cycloheptanicus]
MPKKPVKRVRRQLTANSKQASPSGNRQPAAGPSAAAAPGRQSAFETLKSNLSGKRKAIFEILDDVKKVKPDQWQDPNEVENLAKNFANKLGLPVPEQRIKQFVNAYKDATKNGPNANVDELVQKYGQNVDEKTVKEIKKFVPKSTK